MSADQGMDENNETADIHSRSSSACIDGNDSNVKTDARSVDTKTEQACNWHFPDFGSIDIGEARARATVEEWRTFTMLLEPQVE